MRAIALLSFVLLAGCEEPEENLDGKLVQVQVVSVSSDCVPARFVGDAGVQFFAERADGGLVFTMGQQAQYGPVIDGGVLQGAQRQVVPPTDLGRAAVGNGEGCVGSFSDWKRTMNGVQLQQEWPGADTCPTGPIWLPTKACATTRVFNFTEVGTCQQRCVRISPTSGEVECSC
jgi:hypothetical protein